MNGDQRGFVKFINQLGMVSFGAFVSQVAWVVGSFAFTFVACRMLLSEGTTSESHHSYGLQLAIALLAAWTGKSITNAVANHGVRTTAREYVEAKERGKAVGEALTGERTALAPLVGHADKVEQRVELPTGAIVANGDEHEWTDGDPRAGVL